MAIKNKEVFPWSLWWNEVLQKQFQKKHWINVGGLWVHVHFRSMGKNVPPLSNLGLEDRIVHNWSMWPLLQFPLSPEGMRTCTSLAISFALILWVYYLNTGFVNIKYTLRLAQKIVFIQNQLQGFKKFLNCFSLPPLCSQQRQFLRLPNCNFRISFKEWSKPSITRNSWCGNLWLTDMPPV
jgi:hypothetical protein